MIEIQQQRQGAVVILKPQGALVSSDADVFAQQCRVAMQENLGRVVLDLSQVAFVDSRGLEVLEDASRLQQQGGQALRVCNANRTVREVLDLTGLSPLFEHFQDAITAVRSFL